MSDDLSFEIDLMGSKREALCALLRHGVSLDDACADLRLDVTAVTRWRWLGGPAHDLIKDTPLYESKGMYFRLFALQVAEAEEHWRRTGAEQPGRSVDYHGPEDVTQTVDRVLAYLTTRLVAKPEWSLCEEAWRRHAQELDKLSITTFTLVKAIEELPPRILAVVRDELEAHAATAIADEVPGPPLPPFKPATLPPSLKPKPVQKAQPTTEVKVPSEELKGRTLLEQALELLKFNAPHWLAFAELRDALEPNRGCHEAKTLRQDLKDHPEVEYRNPLGGNGPQVRWRGPR